MHLPEDDERMWRAPPGWFIAYKFWFKESHMFFPLPKLFVTYCEDVRIAFSQLCPAGVRNITGTVVLAAELGMELNLDFYESMSSIAVNQSTPGTMYVSINPKYGMITGHPSKTRNWINEYFFIRVNEASVPDLDRRYRNEWSPIFVRPPFWLNPPANFYEDVRRLSEYGKRKWEDIAETRIKAQWPRIASASWRLKKQKPMGKLTLNLPRYRQEVPGPVEEVTADGKKVVGKKRKKSASAGKHAERKKEKTASGSSSKTVVTIGDRVAAERADPWYAEHPGFTRVDPETGLREPITPTSEPFSEEELRDDPPISSQETPVFPFTELGGEIDVPGSSGGLRKRRRTSSAEYGEMAETGAVEGEEVGADTGKEAGGAADLDADVDVKPEGAMEVFDFHYEGCHRFLGSNVGLGDLYYSLQPDCISEPSPLVSLEEKRLFRQMARHTFQSVASNNALIDYYRREMSARSAKGRADLVEVKERNAEPESQVAELKGILALKESGLERSEADLALARLDADSRGAENERLKSKIAKLERRSADEAKRTESLWRFVRRRGRRSISSGLV
ncbi:unnamed protein product [Microthlaspi erraticum]|uniref:Uncharacterized protein n=1 Tax=Microthlaspi erraticum TaxID=1685480 RepID=A0A6D2IYE0_9BRAS|nr:unnamed protein product [Microthlaspi erraticum]